MRWLWIVLAACNPDPGSDRAPEARPTTKPAAKPASKPAGHEHMEIKGVIRHMKSGGERLVEAGAKGELDPIHAVWGASATDIYAAAWDDPGHGLLHCKGDGKWTHEALDDRRLLGVWGASATDIYVVGNEPVVYHGHGDGKWKSEQTGARGATRAVWGSGPHDIYAAAAYGEIYHSTGDGNWKKQSTGDDTIFLSMWGSGPHDIYAGGNHGKIFHSTGDGTWKVQATLSEYGQIHAIWGASKTDVYATGDGLYHSTGDGAWTKVAVDGLDEATGMWGDANGTLYVGGRSGELFVRRDGKWSHTVDKGGGEYQAIWGTGDDIYVGAELTLTWTD